MQDNFSKYLNIILPHFQFQAGIERWMCGVVCWRGGDSLGYDQPQTAARHTWCQATSAMWLWWGPSRQRLRTQGRAHCCCPEKYARQHIHIRRSAALSYAVRLETFILLSVLERYLRGSRAADPHHRCHKRDRMEEVLVWQGGLVSIFSIWIIKLWLKACLGNQYDVQCCRLFAVEFIQ